MELVYGVGINDAHYQLNVFERIVDINGNNKIKNKWRCPFYHRWTSMLQRCYSENFQNKRPLYKNCTVCNEWLTFSTFKSWMETQDWQGKHLDKDLLFEGNKIYSPETCVFIDGKVNSFLNKKEASRGDLPIGVSYNKASKKYQSQISLGGSKNKGLGYFNTPEDAHLAWRKAKYELAIKLASEQKDVRVALALVKKFKY